MDEYELLLNFCNSTAKENDFEKNLIDFETNVLNANNNLNEINFINKTENNYITNSNDNFIFWKKEINIRKLLLTLQNVLILINLKWKPVEFTDLLELKQVKKIYNRAMTFVHPDKCINLNENELKIAKEIYDCLYTAYQKEINKI